MELRTSAALAALLATAAVGLGGCDYPRDADGTLDRIRGGTMRVGVTENEPWVGLRGETPSGVEVELVKRLADELDSQVEWVPGSEAALVGALERRELDLVIGGLTKDTEWRRKVAITRPYVTTRIMVGFPAGEPARDDLDGVRVAVERGSEAAGLVEHETDATPVRVDALHRRVGPAAAEDFLLENLGLEPTGEELKEEKHVMAVAFGENGWLLRLERYLLDAEPAAREILRRTAAP